MHNELTLESTLGKPCRLLGIALRLSSLALLVHCLVAVANAHTPEQEISPLKLPIGETRGSVMALAEESYGALASCDTSRTGFGFTRRAYFLEICTFTNEASVKLYDETPNEASYYFFEDRLVQVRFNFTQIANEAHFKRCTNNDIKKMSARNSSDGALAQKLKISEENMLTVSEVAMVEKIHSLKESL